MTSDLKQVTENISDYERSEDGHEGSTASATKLEIMFGYDNFKNDPTFRTIQKHTAGQAKE